MLPMSADIKSMAASRTCLYNTLGALTNEEGADSLKSQCRVGMPPHLEIIFERGQPSIPFHYLVRLLSASTGCWLMSVTVLLATMLFSAVISRGGPELLSLISK